MRFIFNAFSLTESEIWKQSERERNNNAIWNITVRITLYNKATFVALIAQKWSQSISVWPLPSWVNDLIWSPSLRRRDMFGARVCAEEICLEPESAQKRYVWSPSLRRRDTFGARVCAEEIRLEPESAQKRYVWSPSLRRRDTFGARVCAEEICLEPESAQKRYVWSPSLRRRDTFGACAVESWGGAVESNSRRPINHNDTPHFYSIKLLAKIKLIQRVRSFTFKDAWGTPGFH